MPRLSPAWYACFQQWRFWRATFRRGAPRALIRWWRCATSRRTRCPAAKSVIQRKKSDAVGRRSGEGFARGRELAGYRVDAEFDDVVGVLIFGEQEPAAGVDGEVARFLAAGRNDLYLRESAVFLVDAVDGEGIMSAIGGVQELAAWMDFDFRRVVAAGKAGRKHGNDLQGLEGLLVVCKHRDRRIEFAKHVQESLVSGKRDVARTGAGFSDRTAGRGECAFARVEAVEQHLVEAKVGDIDKAVVF